MAVPPIARREFLAALACSGLLVPSRSFGAVRYPVRIRKPNPYADVMARAEAGTDEFAFEKEAQRIEERLRSVLRGAPLPLSDDFRGPSPMPMRYKPVGESISEAEFAPGEGFQEGLQRWIASLGQVRRSAFFVLPGNVVRYEIASQGAYRVGHWKQVWKNGLLAEFQPISETLVTAKAPLFDDITAHAFHGVSSFQDQLVKGNVWWRSRLDSATGIDIYGNNGVAVGDIDNDGCDEIYVCQPAGLPNRLYRISATARSPTSRKKPASVCWITRRARYLPISDNSRPPGSGGVTQRGPAAFLNQGDGAFTHVTGRVSFSRRSRRAHSPAWPLATMIATGSSTSISASTAIFKAKTNTASAALLRRGKWTRQISLSEPSRGFRRIL